jgi:hypothetical protein
MSTNDSAFKKSEQELADEIMSTILSLPRFLGKLNYGDHFIHDQGKGQQSWEFKDKHTNGPFKATLISEVASPTYGTLLGSKGNYKALKNFPVSNSS